MRFAGGLEQCISGAWVGCLSTCKERRNEVQARKNNARKGSKYSALTLILVSVSFLAPQRLQAAARGPVTILPPPNIEFRHLLPIPGVINASLDFTTV